MTTTLSKAVDTTEDALDITDLEAALGIQEEGDPSDVIVRTSETEVYQWHEAIDLSDSSICGCHLPKELLLAGRKRMLENPELARKVRQSGRNVVVDEKTKNQLDAIRREYLESMINQEEA